MLVLQFPIIPALPLFACFAAPFFMHPFHPELAHDSGRQLETMLTSNGHFPVSWRILCLLIYVE
jgi:hypothetical protein